jgi:hypothetical protein
MYPHERSLVKKLENKPFILLGVNTDEDRAMIQGLMQQQRITWRSWFDGPTNGPICQAWGVRGFPTIHLIDHRGIIRYVQVRDNLESLIDKLIEEAEKEQS